MRVIKYLLIAAISLTIGIGSSFLVAREALLTWSVWGVKDALVTLHAMSGNPLQFSTQCQQFRTSTAEESLVKTIELAFLNDRQYQLQLICEDFIYEPVVIKSFELGPFVTKVPGSAGFVASPTVPTMISLQLWGRTQTITYTKEATKVTQGTALQTSTLAPVAACKAYGFTCCAQDSTQGSGNSATGATDCPATCFAQCLVKPVVLSFNTQPFFDPKTRTLQVQSGQDVTFSYTLSVPADKIKSVVLDFGDTQTYRSASPSATVNHKYFCVSPSCEYQAKVTVTDTQDLSNVTNSVNQVKVLVNP